jgi:hypothetical protein
MATRVVAELNKDEDVDAIKLKGGLGEFSVFIDGEKVIDSNRLWYPRTGKIVSSVRKLLAK